MSTITIDNIEYDADALSDAAKAVLGSLQVTDRKISDSEADLAIYRTARAAYARELLALLPQSASAE